MIIILETNPIQLLEVDSIEDIIEGFTYMSNRSIGHDNYIILDKGKRISGIIERGEIQIMPNLNTNELYYLYIPENPNEIVESMDRGEQLEDVSNVIPFKCITATIPTAIQ